MMKTKKQSVKTKLETEEDIKSNLHQKINRGRLPQIL